jgi:hypothetical protein
MTTFTDPAAWAGAVAVIVLALTTETPVAAVPPNLTIVAPIRFVPVMVTAVPPIVGPETGVMLVNVGTSIANDAEIV